MCRTTLAHRRDRDADDRLHQVLVATRMHGLAESSLMRVSDWRTAPRSSSMSHTLATRHAASEFGSGRSGMDNQAWWCPVMDRFDRLLLEFLAARTRLESDALDPILPAPPHRPPVRPRRASHGEPGTLCFPKAPGAAILREWLGERSGSGVAVRAACPRRYPQRNGGRGWQRPPPLPLPTSQRPFGSADLAGVRL
jgi:hypothetical protein